MAVPIVRGKRPPERVPGSRIHRGLVGARVLVGTSYMADPALRAEYARDVAPRTTAALGKILREIYPRRRAETRPLRVLDLGAGTGAAGAAVGDHFGHTLDLTSVDLVPSEREIVAMDVTDLAALARAVSATGRFDLVVAAHVLNELHVGEPDLTRLPRLATLVRRWSELLLVNGGTLILLEPALRETSRALLGVRDQVLAAGLHVVAPCFFTGPCPALTRARDWCHDTAIPAPAPAPKPGTMSGGAGRVKGTARPTSEGSGRRDRPPTAQRVDFSYLVVRAAGEPSTDPALFRIVSDPLPEKGRLKLFGCGSSGRHPIARLDRHATTANADFDRLERGDVARITRTTFAQDGLRVGMDTTVGRQTSANADAGASDGGAPPATPPKKVGG